MLLQDNIETIFSSFYVVHMAHLDNAHSSISHANDRRFIDTSVYPSNHWVLQPRRLVDPDMIVLTRFDQSDYAVYLNPEDKRGYRSIVRLINNDQMISTINRDYTSIERIGLALTMALVTEAYTRILPIAQNAIAGNNAQSFNPNTGVIQLGTPQEPIFLHGHVFGRGNPEEKYIEDVQLGGPIPGMIFDMRAQSQDEPGNDKKIHWKPDEMNKVVQRLRAEIESIQDLYKACGLTVISRNVFIDIYLVRHGETDWNSQKRLQGHTDIPLNEQGKLQAHQLREKLTDIDFIQVYSSDFSRTRTTAEIILDSKKTSIIENPLLRERSLGTWEGRLAIELQQYLKQQFDLENLTKEEYLFFNWDDKAETYADVYRRAQTFFRSIAILALENNGPILLCTHGGVLRAILYHLDFRPKFRWEVHNTAVLKLRLQADGQITILDYDGIKLIETNNIAFSF